MGESEQCVPICDSHKSELTTHWRFKRPAIANKAQRKVSRAFLGVFAS
ncbi:DUF4385 family protein [Bradyrhizobium sp. AUGA SZCCT0222]|nr:DUF4385 family protein [Bradyrhizobium sp. AUGA SZCCT0222]